MTQLTRIVFDCNIYLQALSAPRGPSGECVRFALDRKVELFASPFALSELRTVASRPRVAAKLRLTAARIDELIDAIEAAAIILDGFPELFVYPRDSTDAHYVNLAVAADARLLVSRDNDLLSLMECYDGRKSLSGTVSAIAHRPTDFFLPRDPRIAMMRVCYSGTIQLISFPGMRL